MVSNGVQLSTKSEKSSFNGVAALVCKLSVLLACSGTLHATEVSAPYKVVFASAWRNGIDQRLTFQAPERDSIKTVSLSKFHQTALMTTMRRSDDFSRVANGAARTEIVFATIVHFLRGNEYELRWSTMIPVDYVLDSLQPESIAQIHQGGNVPAPPSPPPFALILVDGQYQVDVRGGMGEQSRSFRFGTPATDEGKFVKWSLKYRPDSQGTYAVTDLYKDGVRVVHSVGYPNAFTDDRNAYLKLGIYKWWWKSRLSNVTERTMYYGDVEIGERPWKYASRLKN